MYALTSDKTSGVTDVETRTCDSVEWDAFVESAKQNLNRGRVSNEMASNRVTVRSFWERATHTCLL